MKLIANDYTEKDVMRILRQGTDLKQADFGKSIGLSGMAIQNYERGVRNFTFKTFMKIAKKHGYIVTIEKKEIIIITHKKNKIFKSSYNKKRKQKKMLLHLFPDIGHLFLEVSFFYLFSF